MPPLTISTPPLLSSSRPAGAGVGKSFLLKYLLSKLPTATTFVTASTGIAACALGGVTIHHWAGIGGGERPIKELIEIARRKRGRQWRAATCLIIDEVSTCLDGHALIACRLPSDAMP